MFVTAAAKQYPGTVGIQETTGNIAAIMSTPYSLRLVDYPGVSGDKRILGDTSSGTRVTYKNVEGWARYKDVEGNRENGLRRRAGFTGPSHCSGSLIFAFPVPPTSQ